MIKLVLCLLCCIFLGYLSACSNDESKQIYEKRTTKVFSDVVEDSEFAITEQNFRITGRLHIGNAIQKRGNSSFPENEVILFCNLSLAEKMLRLEPSYINYCPYKVTVTKRGKDIMIGTRLLPFKTGNREMDNIAKNINTILRLVVEYAASDDLFILEED